MYPRCTNVTHSLYLDVTHSLYLGYMSTLYMSGIVSDWGTHSLYLYWVTHSLHILRDSPNIPILSDMSHDTEVYTTLRCNESRHWGEMSHDTHSWVTTLRYNESRHWGEMSHDTHSWVTTHTHESRHTLMSHDTHSWVTTRTRVVQDTHSLTHSPTLYTCAEE